MSRTKLSREGLGVLFALVDETTLVPVALPTYATIAEAMEAWRPGLVPRACASSTSLHEPSTRHVAFRTVGLTTAQQGEALRYLAAHLLSTKKGARS
jgi:hypothetical protein